MLVITPALTLPEPRVPNAPRAVFGASGLLGLMVFFRPMRLRAPADACSPCAESARTGAADGGGCGGLLGDPPIIAHHSHF